MSGIFSRLPAGEELNIHDILEHVDSLWLNWPLQLYNKQNATIWSDDWVLFLNGLLRNSIFERKYLKWISLFFGIVRESISYLQWSKWFFSVSKSKKVKLTFLIKKTARIQLEWAIFSSRSNMYPFVDTIPVLFSFAFDIRSEFPSFWIGSNHFCTACTHDSRLNYRKCVRMSLQRCPAHLIWIVKSCCCKFRHKRRKVSTFKSKICHNSFRFA